MPTALICAMIANVALLSSAAATPFWVAYEGNVFPEDVGWERNFGAYNDPPQSFAHRSVEDGVFILDSLHDDQIYDFYMWHGVPDPVGGELLVAEWRLKVDPASEFTDTGFQVATATLGRVYFKHAADGVYVNFAHYWPKVVSVPHSSAAYHTFRCEITPAGWFAFSVDDVPAFESHLVVDPLPVVVDRVSFGDGVQGAASREMWDYVRFGIVPEPGMLAAIGLALAAGRPRRETCPQR